MIERDGSLVVVRSLECEQVEQGLEVLRLGLVLLFQELVGYQLLHRVKGVDMDLGLEPITDMLRFIFRFLFFHGQ